MARKLELKINEDKDKSKIKLSNLSLDAAKSLYVILDSLVKIIEATPNGKKIRLSIERGSAKVTALGDDAGIIALENDFKDVLERKSRKREIVHNWRNIQDIIHENGLTYEVNFYQNNVPTHFINQIKEQKKFKVKPIRKKKEYELTFLKGELIESGGVKPNVHLMVNGEEKVVACDKQIAKKISELLYSNVYLATWCKKGLNTRPSYTYCDHYLNEQNFNEYKDFIENINELDESDEYVEIHKKIKSFLDTKQFGKIKKLMRLYNHNSADFGSLKTILVITKTFRDNPDIAELRAELKKLLDTKLSKPIA